MNTKTLILTGSGSIWLAFGLWTFLFPESLSGVGLVLDGGLGRTEIRAFYGGLEIGIGSYLLWACRSEERVQQGLVAALFCVAFTGLGRFLGIAMEGFSTTPMMWVFLGVELVGSLLTVWAIKPATVSRQEVSP